MKKLSFIILLSFIFIGICNANPEDNSVYLQTTNQNQLSAPKTKTDLLNRANSMTKYTSYEDLEEQEYFEAEKDITDKEILYKKLFLLSEMVGKRLRKQNQYANVVCVILKDNFFKRKSKQRKLKNATDITSEIYKISKEILDEFYNGEAVRLIGIRLDDLVDYSPYQTSLFDDLNKRDKEEKIDKVIDEINAKLGKQAVKKASLVNTNIKRKDLL